MRAADHPAARSDFDGNTLDPEREVIGALFAHEVAAMAVVDGVLDPGDFGCGEYGTIFDAVRRVYASQRALDLLTVAAELRAMDRLHAVGGTSSLAVALAGFRDYYAPLTHLEAHARIVREAAQDRRATAQATGFACLAAKGAPLDVLQREAAKVAAHLEGRGPGHMVSAAKGAEGVAERLASAGDGRPACVTTGFREVDALIGGLSPGQLVIIAGRPGMGKTSFALTSSIRAAMAEKAAAKREGRRPRRALFVSLEMPENELYDRAVAGVARVNVQKIMRPHLAPMTQDEFDAFQGGVNRIHALPFTVLDLASAKLSQIRAEAKREHARDPLFRIDLDYLQLVSAETSREAREREVAEISRGLKALAKELGVPVVAMAQLNRGVEKQKDKRPMLADLRESGAIEQDADVVMFAYRDEVYDKNSPDRGIAEIIVAKQRNGPTDTVRLRFVRELALFEDMAPAMGDDVFADRPGPVAAGADCLDAHGAGDGLPDVHVPAAQLGFDDLGPQDAAAGAA